MVELFRSKLEQCTILFDFTNPLSQVIAKDIKKSALRDIIQFITHYAVNLPENIYSLIFIMLRKNLFRPLAPRDPFGFNYDPDEDEPLQEAAWPHLQLVYEFFIRLLESGEFKSKLAIAHITNSFISNLLDLFDSEDPREREMLKSTVHRFYTKFVTVRPTIRKSINNIFYTFIYETKVHNGISELLEILESIVNGFTVPIKEEHKKNFNYCSTSVT